MSFYEEYQKYKALDFNPVINRVTDDDIARALGKDRIDTRDFLALLSPRAEMHMEAMARKAHELSLRHFGKSILLYTPLYISNYCVNRCLYCGFNAENQIKRKKLSLEEIEKEAEAISATGLRHILLLTGEAKKHTPVSYISDAARILRKYFDSISIEIYPLTEEEYSEVISAGVDGLTIYQEVYDEDIYERVHVSGPKRDYRFRLEAPERACRAGIRSVNIGALLGLGEWRREVFIAGLHAQYLQKKHADVETSLSLPRIRPHAGSCSDIYPVEDSNLVQALLALRIFLPYAGITISTRERQQFRDNLIPLGVTKMSAGVSTEVGGHSLKQKGEGQFEICDTRNVHEIRDAILKRGYQPVFKDWMKI